MSEAVADNAGRTAEPDAEFGSIQAIFKALQPLSAEARVRVIEYIVARFEIELSSGQAKRAAPPLTSDETDEAIEEEQESAQKFGSFAELFDAAAPSSNGDKALVAGYWLQVCEGSDTFSGQSANTELRNLGEHLANITNAMDSLKNQKPALALQLKKSGKSQQARKVYKITVAGIRAVEGMLNG